MKLLRTNTATRVTVGPIQDVADGVTPLTSLTATSAHLSMTVDNGGVPTLALDVDATASGGNNDLVHVSSDNNGHFDLELTAANTNYLGRAKLSICNASEFVPVWEDFLIVPGAIYDWFVLGTAIPDVNATKLAGTTQTPGIDLGGIIPDSVPADGTRPTPAQALYMIAQFLMERSTSGTTVTVKKVDGSTTLMTLTINDGTTPTSITRS